MMHLTIYAAPSLHGKQSQARRDLLDSCRAALMGRTFARVLHNVTISFRGDWFRPNGKPRERNADNVFKLLADCLAEAGDLGKRGRGDQHLTNGNVSWSVEQSDIEIIEITITPQ